jgi:hypothetical protein
VSEIAGVVAEEVVVAADQSEQNIKFNLKIDTLKIIHPIMNSFKINTTAIILK